MSNTNHEKVRDKALCDCCNGLWWPKELYQVCWKCRNRAAFRLTKRPPPLGAVVRRAIIITVSIAIMIIATMQ